MTTDILLINVHSSRNAGDAALTIVAVEQLQQHFPGCKVTLAMDDPRSHTGAGKAIHSFFTWLKVTRPDGRVGWHVPSLLWLLPGSLLPILTYRLIGRPVFAFTPPRWRELIEAYTCANLIVSKPGGFLYSSGRGVTLLISIYSMALALLAGKPLYIFPQSIGPLHYRWERRLLGGLFSRTRLVMTREPVSQELALACGAPPDRCILLPDMAFAFSGLPQAEAEAWLQSHGIRRDLPLLGMTAINWGAQDLRFTFQDRYEAACAAAARLFVKECGGQVILFPQVWGPAESQDDRVPARRIAAQLPDLSGSVRVVEEPLPPELLKPVYGRMDVFIGTRMHSNIFALSEGTPIIAIGYQHKTQGITQMAGLEAWTLDIRQIGEQDLVEKLRALWQDREAVRREIRMVIPLLIDRAQKAGEMVAADYTGYLVARKKKA